MLIKNSNEIPYSEVTPQSIYLNRRKFLAGVPAAFLAGRELLSPSRARAAKLENVGKSQFSTTEPPNTYDVVTRYNNFYEFGTAKSAPAKNAQNFKTYPWTVSVEGDVAKPRKFSIDDIMKLAPLEERIYRHRCVEGWSIVVPWVGYSLGALLKQVEPTPKAKYVAFESYWNLSQMPLARAEIAGIEFPYVEGLRLDEAMHPLALLCFGMYGSTLPPQDGAPVRLVVPWKYGFKSIKSIVKIKLTGGQPSSTWNMATPQEYGFYSNVNPNVDHPRWSQAVEQRLPSLFKNHPTQMFNGYGDQVASLYKGMDLKKYY
ncbi:MAG TPA: protein-methionine-sulfoxide reductase catalytic subunit MsrP [Bryobacteraceae bacterium]|nr:protein-methionine-sulfoxide reductase catalytic subunit MsrP [Bryobacteraceae bacterium]